MSNSRKRHIAKAFSWRIIGTADTMLLAWFITGNGLSGFKIGGLDFFTKLVLYYLHERVWFKVKMPESKKRHLFKTVTWRTVGSLDTFLLGWLITGNPTAGFTISLSELLTKMVLYYIHERLWYRIDFGLKKRRSKREARKRLRNDE